MTATKTMLLAAMVWAATASPQAQQPVSKANVVKISATITAVDPAKRMLTLRDDAGNEDTFNVSQDVQRFNELMVGQKVNLTYYESVVYQLVKAGEKGSGTSFDAAVNRGAGALPAATIATQEKMTVTVKSIDATVPSVTVAADDGRVVTRKIENKKNLENLKPGDKIDITFTRALVTSVSPAELTERTCDVGGTWASRSRDAYARTYWPAAILLSVGRPSRRNARAWGLATTGVACGKTQLPLRISARGLIEAHHVVPPRHDREAVGRLAVTAAELYGDGAVMAARRGEAVDAVGVASARLEVAVCVVDADRPEPVHGHISDGEPVHCRAVVHARRHVEIRRLLLRIPAPVHRCADQVTDWIHLRAAPEHAPRIVYRSAQCDERIADHASDWFCPMPGPETTPGAPARRRSHPGDDAPPAGRAGCADQRASALRPSRIASRSARGSAHGGLCHERPPARIDPDRGSALT